MSQAHADFAAALDPGEAIVDVVVVDGAHASKHPLPLMLSAPRVVVTDRRFIVFDRHGIMKKRYEVAGSWDLTSFQTRSNANQGTALGPFLYFLTLTTHDDESVSAAFKTSAARDSFKELVHEVIARVNGI